MKTLNWFECLLLASIILLSLYKYYSKDELSVNDYISCVSATLGVFCVVLGAKGSMANWIFGIVEGFLYTYIAFSGHIFGDALQRLFYTLPMQFVGWHLWSKRRRDDDSTQIKTRYMTWATRGKYLLAMLLLIFSLGMLLKHLGPYLTEFITSLGWKIEANYTNELQLWMDASTTILFAVALFISTKAYVEQWYLWMFINVFSIIIWSLSTTDFSFMMVAKYSVYLVNSFYGIYMWNKLSKD